MILHILPVPPRRRRGFTLVELLMVMGIGMVLAAIGWPVMTATLRDMRTHMAVGQAGTAIQANMLYAREYAQANANAAEPRVAGSTYAGTSVVFDQVNHKAWFCVNNQRAVPDDKSAPYIEVQDSTGPNMSGMPGSFTDKDSAGTLLKKKAYERIRGNSIEHLDLPAHQMYYGVTATHNPDGTIANYALVGPRAQGDRVLPFAVCTFLTGESMPQRSHIFVDLLDGDGYLPVATSMPMLLVVPKDAGTGFDTTYLNAVPGADDREKINNLLKYGHARLLSLALGGASKL